MEITWTTVLVALLNVLVGGALVTLIRIRPAMRKIENEREESLLKTRGEDMEAMRHRIDQLEAHLETERGERATERARYDAERAMDRHRINNLQQCLDALLLLIETNPAKSADAVKRIKEMRAAQIVAEAAEKATIHAATIHALGERTSST